MVRNAHLEGSAHLVHGLATQTSVHLQSLWGCRQIKGGPNEPHCFNFWSKCRKLYTEDLAFYCRNCEKRPSDQSIQRVHWPHCPWCQKVRWPIVGNSNSVALLYCCIFARMVSKWSANVNLGECHIMFYGSVVTGSSQSSLNLRLHDSLNAYVKGDPFQLLLQFIQNTPILSIQKLNCILNET